MCQKKSVKNAGLPVAKAQKIRYRLMSKHRGICQYCGVRMKLPKKNHEYKIIPAKTATLDHYYSRFDIRRYIPGQHKNVILCCYQCNQNRAKRENNLYGKQRYADMYPPFDIRELLNPASATI